MVQTLSKMLRSRLNTLQGSFRYCLNTQHVNCSSSSNVAPLTEKWDLFSSVCLLRRPVITSDLKDIEKEFANTLHKLEYEKSLKSNHELRHENDLKVQALMKNPDATDLDVELSLKQTAQDYEDACIDEYSKFIFPSRVTEADNRNDKKSIDRKLDCNLMLFGLQKIGKSDLWVMPYGVRQEGETMRQTAERILRDYCGSSVKAQFLGNAPCGFYKYKYPKSVSRVNGSAVGAKIFFFKANFLSGDIKCCDPLKDFMWLTSEELVDPLKKDYVKAVSQFLSDL